MKEKFKDKFERVDKKIQEENISDGWDNVMGLTYLDGMVDVITQNQALRDTLHKFITDIIFNAMNFEFEVVDTAWIKDFV